MRYITLTQGQLEDLQNLAKAVLEKQEEYINCGDDLAARGIDLADFVLGLLGPR